ncbi:MAG TPA: DUF6600 domain-containing protein [Hyphomicrobiaceae bacterium]|nr:DUF6600 domain-containing protein [Hyphomicrobiaceae bacterium]
MSITMRSILLGALLALMVLPAAPVRAQDNDVDVSYFYEELEQYGRWIDHPRWGDVWSPDVDRDWRPYTIGYWNYTEDNGWFWVSEEPFGWAVFHYGRWVVDPDDGWLWIPGTEWAPAWVAWRSDDSDDGYVGWAPLPPDARWGPNGDLEYDEYYYDEPLYASAWVFVRPTYLTQPGLYRFVAPRPQNYIYLRRTRHLHAYRKHDRRVFNAGLDVRRYERLVGRPVPRVRVRITSNPREQNFRHGGPEISVFRPNIIERRDGDRRRPNFRDRPPGDSGPSVRRPPDGRFDGRSLEPGKDWNRDNNRNRGPDGKDIGKGPDFRPDIRDGQKGRGGPGERGPGPDGPGQRGPASVNKEPPGGQGGGQPPFKGPPINEPPKQPFFKDQGFKAPSGGPDKGDDRGPDNRGRARETREFQGVPKEPAFKGPPSGHQNQPAFKGPPTGNQNQPAFKGPPSGNQNQGQPALKGPPQKPVVQDQRPARPPEQKPQRPPDKKEDRKDDKKGPPGPNY